MNWKSLLVPLAACTAAFPGAHGASPAVETGFAGNWRLERITDGERTRTDLDEHLALEFSGDTLEFEYRIVDRFGTRTLQLRAPLDGTPLEQTVQARRAVVTARMEGSRLVLSIERDAPFGHIHNRRSMQLVADGRRMESYRENFTKKGTSHSAWRESWLRVD